LVAAGLESSALESLALAGDGGLRLVLDWRVSAGAPAAWSEETRAETLMGADGEDGVACFRFGKGEGPPPLNGKRVRNCKKTKGIEIAIGKKECTSD
jgi:hypothetical protein